MRKWDGLFKIRRKIRIDGELAFIPLTKGYEAIIDIADLDLVSNHNWYAKVGANTVYANRRVLVGKGKYDTVAMHRVIMSAPKGMDVDHVNGNGLDNCRANLRLATHSQNMMNQRKSAANTSGAKGVYWCKYARKWIAHIKLDGKKRHIGCFNSFEVAVSARYAKSVELFGEFSHELSA